MKSIKPGRGPSMMGAVGSAAAAVFGIFWTITAVSMGAPGFFALFGLVFVAMGIAQAVYNFKNATSQNRYSAFDITDGSEEPDPLNQYFGGDKDRAQEGPAQPHDAGEGSHLQHQNHSAFCPYCGAEVEGEFSFCPKCGKKLPGEPV